MITTFNLFNAIAWIVAGFISAIISILFLTKNPKKKLNQLFSAGFLFWSFSLIFNGINFTVAYSSVFIANIFRDLCVVTGILCALTLFIASVGIYFGAEKVNWILMVILTILGIVLSVFGTINDWVTEDGFGGYKTTDNWFGKTCVQIIPAIFVIVGLVLLILTYFTLENKAAKKRIGYFTLGFTTIVLGLLMFVFDAIVEVSPYIFLTLAISSWVAGPILMLIGFYVKPTTNTHQVVVETVGTTDTKILDSKQQQQQKLERPS
ncbi:MAG: hypothetical protein ACTSQK_06020 [Candidatus Heimdallarchaeota archaeon]